MSMLLVVEMDTPGTSILLVVERDTPCTSILLAVDRDTLHQASLLYFPPKLPNYPAQSTVE
jgi:hypothetical protein